MNKRRILITLTVLFILTIIQAKSNLKNKIPESLTSAKENTTGFIDNFDYDWPSKSKKISPNGLWNKIQALNWGWNDGLTSKNAFTINEPFSQLCLQVKKNGRGAEIDSTSKYHYGLYKAKIKASKSTKKILNPSGVCNGFFVYWQENDAVFEEIDVELLSKDPRYVYFTIHRGKSLFNPPKEENWSTSSGPIRVKGKRPDKDFHEYGFKWLKDRVEFFIDDFSKPVWVYKESDDPSSQHIPSNPATLIFNNWTGAINWTGSNPKKIRKMYVDWVEYIPENKIENILE